ncbi:MAG: nucleotidyl transferase AbiEii/AbiGii toxin family protein [Bacteroidales bacterium]
MLYPETIDPSTLGLLKSLQSKSYLDDFYLAGGTALALYYGHRKSIDIDLFTNKNFDTQQMIESVQQDFSLQLFYTAANTIKGSISNINVDVIAHRYPYLNDPVLKDGIRILSESDIIAMKLNAISTSGQRSKDFIDIYFALEKYQISSMLLFYQKKYNQHGDMQVLKSLVYFDDVDLSDWPVLIKETDLTWALVKKRIEKEVLHFIKKNND